MGNSFPWSWYATGRTRFRASADTLRRSAEALWKLCGFLRFRDPHDDPSGYRLGFNISVRSRRPHPPLQGAGIETRFLFDFPVAKGRAAQHPSRRTLLMRLPQHQPRLQPDRRTHSGVMTLVDEAAPQSGVVIFPPHPAAAVAAMRGPRKPIHTGREKARTTHLPQPRISTPRNRECALVRIGPTRPRGFEAARWS